MKVERTVQLDSRVEKRLVEHKALAHRGLCYGPDDPEWRALSAFADGAQMSDRKLFLVREALDVLIDKCGHESTERAWEEVVPGEGGSGLIRDHAEMRRTLAEARQQQRQDLEEVRELTSRARAMIASG
jgi:hypothetical protein